MVASKWAVGPVSQPGRYALAALVGVGGSLLFLFAFPGSSLSTLAHYVLHLPAPGAGIALVLGPVTVLVMLAGSRVVRRVGGALLAALAFALTCGVVMRALGRPAAEKAMVGSLWFVLALAASGLIAEVLQILGRSLPLPWKLVLTACGANVGLLVFCWVVIFPRTMGWVSWNVVPVLLAVSLAAGALAGLAAWAIAARSSNSEVPLPRR
jgi:hypothetical protein